MSELTPITRKEHIMSGADITPITREEMFLQKIVEGGGGGGGLPAYTSADVGKALTLGEDAEHSTEEFVASIIPEETVTVENDSYTQQMPLSIGYSALRSRMDDHMNAHGNFDDVILRVNGNDYQCTGSSIDGGDYVYFFGSQVPRYTISATSDGVTLDAEGMAIPVGTTLTVAVGTVQTVSGVAPVWTNKTCVLPVATEVYTRMATIMQTAVPAAIAKGVGVPHYVAIDMQNMNDTEAWDAYTEQLKQAVANKDVFVIDQQGILLYPFSASYYDISDEGIPNYGSIGFVFVYVVNGYTIEVHMSLITYIFSGVKKYGIGGTFTVVNAPSNP